MNRIPFIVFVTLVPYLIISVVAAQTPDLIVVTAEGRARGVGAAAMERAKDAALRRAVENAVDSFITTQSKTDDFAGTLNRAFTNAAGYVTQFDILSQRTEAGNSYCTVRAKVSRSNFEKDWSRLIRATDTLTYPRCLFVVLEDNDVDDSNPRRTSGIVQGVLERYFIEKGVQLMDHVGSSEVRYSDLELAAETDDIPKLARMASTFKAEAVILGDAEAKRGDTTEVAGSTMYEWTATLNIRAYRTDNGQLLMSNMYTTTVSTPNVGAGGDNALRVCAQENVRTILKDLGEAWRRPAVTTVALASRNRYMITLQNCHRPDFQNFLDTLRTFEGVRTVHSHTSGGDECDAVVEYDFELSQLVGRIEATSGGKYLLLHQTPSSAIFRIRK
ncbi:MAG TPA: hypothetical protein VMV81_06315 [Phycisphaerae bacterium]|nr:hypothetical protein [Phycisphaerae bacterium]